MSCMYVMLLSLAWLYICHAMCLLVAELLKGTCYVHLYS